MYTVMLVDDDVPVLEFLQKMIPWESLDLLVTGSYENGADALEAALRHAPDIVITDIGMPEMDGIQLMRELQRLDLNCKTVIVSCHHEFEYAREAVKLEVIEYILKESLQVDAIVILLRRIIDKIAADRESGERLNRWRHLHERSVPARKQQFFASLFDDPLLDMAAWADQAEEFGLDWKLAYAPVLCCPAYAEAIKRYGSKETFHFAVENIAAELLKAKGAMFSRDSFQVMLLPVTNNRPVQEQLDFVTRVTRVQQAALTYLKVRTTMLAGQGAFGPTQLRDRLRSLAEKLPYRFYIGHGRIVWDVPEEPFSGKDLFAHYALAMDEFRQIVLDESEDRVTQVVHRWFDRIRSERYEPGMVKDWTLKMMIDLKLKLKSLSYFQSDFSHEVLHPKMAKVESVHELEEWLSLFLHEAIATMDEIVRGPQKREVMEAIRYIESRLNKRIGLEEVAGNLHLSMSYFSRLFKRETGEGFVEYVTKRKMEKAKELLTESGNTVDEIAYLLGYDNKNYFLKLFKQHTGSTPGEYAGKSNHSGWK